MKSILKIISVSLLGLLISGVTYGKNITIINSTSTNTITVFMGFVGPTYFGPYSPASFPLCMFNTGNQYVCQFQVTQGTPVTMRFPSTSPVSVAFTATNMPWGACPTSLAEFNLYSQIGGQAQDTIDVSLLNGINTRVAISTTSDHSLINMKTAVAPFNNILGIYPPGCDGCAVSINPPTWPGCPGKQPSSNCQAGTQYNPSPGCQITRPSGADSYNVTFTNL